MNVFQRIQTMAPRRVLTMVARMRQVGLPARHILRELLFRSKTMANGAIIEPRKIASESGELIFSDPDLCRPERDKIVESVILATRECRGSIAIIGARGVGKTQIAATLIGNRCDPEFGCGWMENHPRYSSLTGLLRSVRATFNGEGNEANLFREMERASLLVVDDLQDGSGRSFQEQTMTDLFDARYGNQLPTIFIASSDREGNLSAKVLAGIVGPSIVDRFTESGSTVVPIAWPSVRADVCALPDIADVVAWARSSADSAGFVVVNGQGDNQ
jgi:hypothetical protein